MVTNSTIDRARAILKSPLGNADRMRQDTVRPPDHEVVLSDLECIKDNEQFVQTAHQSVLGRDAGSACLASWLGHLDSATLSRAEFIEQLVKSEEGQLRRVCVHGLELALAFDSHFAQTQRRRRMTTANAINRGRTKEARLRAAVIRTATRTSQNVLAQQRIHDRVIGSCVAAVEEVESQITRHKSPPVPHDSRRYSPGGGPRRIAMITPWPKQPTGIADYAFDLTVGLAQQGVEVDVFTNCTDRATAPANVTIRDLDRFTGVSGYDQLVYQIGNCSDFHADQLPVLAEHPGVVHLHDMMLHHFIAFFLYRDDCGRNPADYYRVLEYWYGPEIACRVRKHHEGESTYYWDSPFVCEAPFFDPVLQFATGCIVHSKYARDTIRKRWPRLAVYTHPQVYRNMQPAVGLMQTEPMSSVLQIGVFGIVHPHKNLDVLMNAVAQCNVNGEQVHLHVCGALDVGCEHMPQLAHSLGIADHTTFHGRMSEAEFLESMRSVDMCVALRYPTMGETSAVVSRALQLGLPTVVNDVGWYAELPDCVRKISVDSDAMRQALVQTLQQLSSDRLEVQRWRSRCVEFAQKSLSFDGVTQRYIDLLDQLGGRGSRRAIRAKRDRLTA